MIKPSGSLHYAHSVRHLALQGWCTAVKLRLTLFTKYASVLRNRLGEGGQWGEPPCKGVPLSAQPWVTLRASQGPHRQKGKTLGGTSLQGSSPHCPPLVNHTRVGSVSRVTTLEACPLHEPFPRATLQDDWTWGSHAWSPQSNPPQLFFYPKGRSGVDVRSKHLWLAGPLRALTSSWASADAQTPQPVQVY